MHDRPQFQAKFHVAEEEAGGPKLGPPTGPMSIPLPLKYHTRVWFLDGGHSFTPKNTAQEKFVANPWTFEENKQPSIPYKGSFCV